MKAVISCRPDENLAAEFEKRVKALDVSDSELARRAIIAGLDLATRQIMDEKRREAAALLKRFAPAKKGSLLPFNPPAAPFVNNALTPNPLSVNICPDGMVGVVAQLVEHHNGIVRNGSVTHQVAKGVTKNEPSVLQLSVPPSPQPQQNRAQSRQ